MPIFTDESIYIRWAEIARFDSYWRFISLSDGKQPLFVWLMMLAIPYFKDPVFAGRLISVLAGFSSLIGMYFLARFLYGKKNIAVIAAVCYLFYPFALMYDRMALMDTLVGTFTIWALLFEVILIQTLRLDVAMILGFLIGGATLTKSSGFFNLYLLPFSLLLFPWNDKKRKSKLLMWFLLAVVALIESQVMYAVLRLSPLFSMISEKNSVFIYPLKEWLTHPWRFFWGNLRGMFDWFIHYFGWPMFAFFLVGFVSIKNIKKNLLCLVWFAAPFVALALFGRVLYPRFIFFMTLSLIPVAAFGIDRVLNLFKSKAAKVAFLLIAFLFWMYVDWRVLKDPYTAPIPKADKNQYLNDWPAGGGIKEVVNFLEEKSKNGKVYVGTEGTFGPLPYALEVYLYRNQNVEIKGFWPLSEKIPPEATMAAAQKDAYFVFNQTQKVPVGWPLEEIARYRKGIGDVYLTLCRIIRSK